MRGCRSWWRRERSFFDTVVCKINFMVNGRELRIGNLVQNLDSTVCPVGELVERDGVINVSAACQPPDSRFRGYREDFSPIPLTAQILAQLGFSSMGATKYYVRISGTFDLEVDLQLKVATVKVINTPKYIDMPCTSVHQLQNVYFVITATELDVSKLQTKKLTF